MIMIPIGVLVILILRNLIGLQTLGTFTPVLIALAFRETGLQWGIALFTVITALGLSLRSYLEHLKLQMLPRLGGADLRGGDDRGDQPVQPQARLRERPVDRPVPDGDPDHDHRTPVDHLGRARRRPCDEGGHRHPFAASLAHILMRIPELVYFIFTFPAVLLILVAFMLAMGRYRGYRLTELFRFKALLKD